MMSNVTRGVQWACLTCLSHLLLGRMALLLRYAFTMINLLRAWDSWSDLKLYITT